VGASGLGHATEAMTAVAHDGAAWMDITPGERGNRLAGEAVDAAELHAHRLALGGRFNRGDEGRLPWRAASAFTAGSR